MVTEPVAAYLGWAGEKWEITDDLCSGLLTDTVRVRARLAGERAAGAGDGGAYEGSALGVGVRAGATGRTGAGLASDLLMVTEPTASYTWSAGRKWEITLWALSGVLTDTVRVKARLEADEAPVAEREAEDTLRVVGAVATNTACAGRDTLRVTWRVVLPPPSVTLPVAS